MVLGRVRGVEIIASFASTHVHAYCSQSHSLEIVRSTDTVCIFTMYIEKQIQKENSVLLVSKSKKLQNNILPIKNIPDT